MEDFVGFICFVSALAVGTALPLALLLVPLKLWRDIGTLRLRVADLEHDVHRLRSRPMPAAAAPAESDVAGGPPAPEQDVELPSLPPTVGLTMVPTDDLAPADPDAPEALQGEPVADVDGDDVVDDGSDTFPAAAREAWSPPSPERIAVLLGASIGGLALLIGLVLGLVAVLDAGILGPAARITGGLVTGTFLWVLGASLRGRLVAVPSALAGAGMGALFGAVFSAHSLYDLIGPTVAFLALVLISFVAGLRATVLEDRFMAYLGLFGGLLAPVAVSTGQNGAVGLFGFLFMLSIGTLTAATYRRWPDLIAACMAGCVALYVGWTASWLAPDSVRVALVSAFVLAVPYAIASTRCTGVRPVDHATRWVAGAGSLVWMLTVLPWLVPLDPRFVDPLSGVAVFQSTGMSRQLGALAIALLPLPAWLAARSRGSTLASTATTVLATLGSITWTVGWSEVLDTPDAWLVLAPLAPLAVGLMVHAGRRRQGVALGMLLLPWAGSTMSAAQTGLSPAWIGGALVLATLLGLGGSVIGSTAPLQLCLLLGGTAVLTSQALLPAPDTLWICGGLLLLLGAVPPASLASPWRDDRAPQLGWVAGTIAGIVVFPAAYLTWDATLGTAFIGALPVLLGAHALLVTAVLVRVRRLRLEHPMVLLAIALVLSGVTIALPIQLEAKWLTVGWAMEAAAIAWLSTRIRQPLLRWTAALLGVTVGVRLLINPWALAYGTASGLPILNWTLYTWGVPTLCLVAAAHLLDRSRPETTDSLAVAPSVLRLLAMGTGFALVNVQVSHAFQNAGPLDLAGTTMLQGMVRSLAWGGWGLGLLLVGLAVNSRMTRFVGFAFMLLAAAKVFVFDLWAMPGFVRVGSLIGLGVTLLVSAVLFNRLVLREPSASGES